MTDPTTPAGARRPHRQHHRDDAAEPARTLTAAVVAAGLLVVLSPVRHHWTKSPSDSFPLSFYPMFSARRKATVRVVHPVGIRADGRRTRLSYHYCGTGGFNQVRRQLVRSVKDGRAEEVAAEVARALGAAPRRGDADVVAVEVVTGTYRYRSWFEGEREPERTKVHARADVPDRGQGVRVERTDRSDRTQQTGQAVA